MIYLLINKCVFDVFIKFRYLNFTIFEYLIDINNNSVYVRA